MGEYDIFLTYNHRDSDFAQIIARYLSDIGFKVWFDQWSLSPGSSYLGTIKEPIKTTKIMLFLIGADQTESSFESEISYIQKVPEKKFIIPVLLPGAVPENIPLQFKMINYLDLRDGGTSITKLDALIDIFQNQSSLKEKENKESFLELIKKLKDQKYFVNSWNHDEFEIKKLWARIESESPFRMVDAYEPIIKNPNICTNFDFLYHLGELLTDTNKISEAIVLFEYLKKQYEEKLDYSHLQLIMTDLAWCLYLNGEIEKSSTILQVQERICREKVKDSRERDHGLQRSFGYQALIHEAKGENKQALQKYHEQQKICLETEDKYWLQISVGNEGLLLKSQGKFEEAWRLFNQKEQISREISNMQGLQWALNYKADICVQKRNYQSAFAFFKEQEKICRDIGYSRGLRLSLKGQEYIDRLQKYTTSMEMKK